MTTDIHGMKILTMQERVNFVDDVLEACNIQINDNEDTLYHPVTFDVVFKAYVLKYFFDVDLSKYDQDELCEVVYGNEFCEQIDKIYYSDQVDSLKVACLSQIDRSHKEYLTFALLSKKDRLDEFIDFIEDWLERVEKNLKNVDAKQLVKSVDKIASIVKNDNDTVAKKVAKTRNNLKVYSNPSVDRTKK